jgi:hypothetical protein
MNEIEDVVFGCLVAAMTAAYMNESEVDLGKTGLIEDIGERVGRLIAAWDAHVDDRPHWYLAKEAALMAAKEGAVPNPFAVLEVMRAFSSLCVAMVRVVVSVRDDLE